MRTATIDTPPPGFSSADLLAAGGPGVFKTAKALVAGGAVISTAFEAPVLRGKVREKTRVLPVLLKFRPGSRMEIQCPCADAARRGLVCAHAVAAGLFYLESKSPTADKPAPGEAPAVRREEEIPHTPGGQLPEVVLSIEGSTTAIEASLQFEYPAGSGRNPDFEKRIAERLEAQGFKTHTGRLVLSGALEVMRFFASAMPGWEKSARLETGPRFQKLTKDWVRLEPSPVLSKHDGWLDFRMHFRAGAEAVLAADELRRLLAGGNPSVRLKSGRLAIADPAALNETEEFLRDIDPVREGDSWRVDPRFERYLQRTVSEWTGRTPPEPADADGPGPALQEILRPYQLDGARWMLRLARENFGGLLADEMGLGKTVQTLAAFARMPGPHLIVCPSSLVWNWQSEIARFLPGKNVLLWSGSDRAIRSGGISGADFVITSYALLQRDTALLRDQEFGCVALDEAQHIKNPLSQNAKAARALRARARFVLTGTPLENSLRDLWSLFQFLLPGYLGDRADFRDRYEIPLQSEGPESPVWLRFRRRLAPFFLRRTKAEVVRELPEKIEQTIFVPLGEQERSVYDSLQAAARERLDSMQNAGGEAPGGRMLLLTALLRLRQACCDPRLLGDGNGNSAPPETGQPSSKLAAFLELVEEAVDGGHRALVFSQFTTLLDLCEPLLDKAGIGFLRLDGATKNREDIVRKFQNDSGPPVFLLSLKAGGAGLNLTAADTVIHLDPWWNPAAEAQATGRSHRIGQNRVVTAIRLVARDTIEERVLAMQDSKRRLFAEAVTAFEGATPSFKQAGLNALRDLI